MDNQDIIDQVALELNLRGKSEKKIKKYLFHIDCFLGFRGHDIDTLEEEDVKDYLAYLKNVEKDNGYIKSAISSIKFLYSCYGKSLNIKKQEKRKEEFESIQEINLLKNSIYEINPRIVMVKLE